MVRAWEGFQYKDYWQDLQKRGMGQDFSWYRSAKQYDKLYRSILGLPEAEEHKEPETEQPGLILKS